MALTEKQKSVLKLIMRVLVTTVLLVWVFRKIDLLQFWQVMKDVNWLYLIAVWILTAALFWVRSLRMRMILKKLDCDVSISTIFGASMITCLYSLVIPGILSTGAKWLILKKGTGKGTNVLSSMVYNQLSTMVVLMIFGLGALAITNPAALILDDTKNRYLLPIVCIILLVAVLLISMLLLNGRTGGRIITSFGYLLKPLPEKIRRKGLLTLDQIAFFTTIGVRFHLIIAVHIVVTGVGGGVATYILASRCANITTIPTTAFIWLWAIIFILGRIPISIANLGVREVTLVGLLSLYGVDESQALLLSMVIFSSIVFVAGIGLIYQLNLPSFLTDHKAASIKKRD
jgi:uncharacterized membrane protein YbhN (UPF0104 family)